MAVDNAGGTIFFANDGTTASGNDNNTISFCNIGPAGINLPTKAIFALGTTNLAGRNSGIVIANNNIFDFFQNSDASGIHILSGNDNWTISNNRIYQTAPRVFASNGARYSGISFNSSAGTLGSITITGNIIGFGAANGSGTTTISGAENEFRGIVLAEASKTTLSSIQGNIISGINLTTARKSNNEEDSGFIGIQSGVPANDAPANIGTTTGNIIGSLDGTSTIVVNASATAANTVPVIGILDFSAQASAISNNSIGSITINNGGAETKWDSAAL
jgi:hypothetical protein